MSNPANKSQADLATGGRVDWRRGLVTEETTLQDAIRNLNDSSLQIALVVSSSNRLIGTVTDGDIRRGLLGGMQLNDPIGSIAYHDPLVVPPEMGRETVLQLMQAVILKESWLMLLMKHLVHLMVLKKNLIMQE